jgi:hypothetical protein
VSRMGRGFPARLGLGMRWEIAIPGVPAAAGNNFDVTATDTISVSDALQQADAKRLTDSITVTETLAKARAVGLTDTITVSEAIHTGPVRQLVDEAFAWQFADDFNRTVGAGSLGNGWTLQPSSSTWAVDGAEAVKGPIASGGIVHNAYQPAGSPDVITQVLTQVDSWPLTTGPHSHGLLFGYDGSSSSNAYRARLQFNSTNTVTFNLAAGVAGTFTTIATLTPPLQGTPQPGEWWWIKAERAGQTVRAKAWRLGTPEPAAWDVSGTDTTVTPGLNAGLTIQRLAGETGSVTWEFDNYQQRVTDFITVPLGQHATLTDSITVSESIGMAATRALADTIAVSDVLRKAAVKQLVDTISVSDSLADRRVRALAETIVVSDQLRKTEVLLQPTDTISVADAIRAGPGRLFADTIAVSDALATKRARALTDTIAISDVLAGLRNRQLADTITISDALAKGGGVQRPLADTITVSDALAKAAVKQLADTIAISDALPTGPIRALVDYIPTALESDTFTRTVAASTTASWGTTDTGQTWTTLATSTGQTYGVNGSAATNSIAAGDSGRRGQSIPAGGVNQEAVAQFAQDALPVGAAYVHSMYLRMTDVNNLYAADMLITTTGNIQYRLRKVIASTGTILVSAANVPGIGIYTPGTYVWVRSRIEGNTLMVRIWKDGTAEPSTWTAQVTDSNISAGSLVGAGGQGNASQTTATNQTIDNFSARLIIADVLPSGPTPRITDSISVSDSLARRAAPALSDSITVSDALPRAAVHGLADTIAVSDALAGAKGPVRQLVDTGFNPGASASDAFGRAAVSGAGWGVGDSGFTWSQLQGGVAATALTGSAGTLTPPAASTESMLDGLVQSDGTWQVDMTWSADAVGGAQTGGLFLRWTDLNNHLRVQLNEPAGSPTGVTLLITKNVAGTATQVNLPSFAFGTVVAGTMYTVKARAMGTLILAKAWQVGSSEPDWQTSGRLNAGELPFGLSGIRAFVAGTNTAAPTFTFDNYAVTPLAEYIAVNVNRIGQLVDTISVSDTLAATGAHAKSASLSDTISVSDVLATKRTHILADSIAISDTLSIGSARNVQISLTDSALSGLLLPGPGVYPGSGTFPTPIDYLTTTRKPALSDSVSISDSLATRRARALADTISVSDSLVASGVHARSAALSDTISVSDTLARQRVAPRALSDTIAVSDQLPIQANRMLSESIVVSDTISVPSSGLVGTPYTVAANVSDTTNTATATIVTNVDVQAGDTLFIGAACRLGTAAVISSLTGVTLNEVVGHTHPTNPLGASLARVYCATLLPAGTSIGVTFSAATTRKGLFAFAVPGVGNDPVDQDAGADGTTGTPTLSTPSPQTSANAIAIAVFARVAVANTDVGTPGAGFTEQADFIVGASTFDHAYGEWDVLTSNASPTTASYTPSDTTHNWAAVLGVWDGAVIGAPVSLTDSITVNDVLRTTPTHLSDTIAVSESLVAAGVAPLVRAEYSGTPRFVLNSNGRQIYLRGANTIQSANNADRTTAMVNLGVNFVRVVLNWHNLETTAPTGSGTNFATYVHTLDSAAIAQLDSDLAFYAANGIYFQIDMHQASWSPYYGGSGIPSWYYTDSRFTSQQNGGAGWNNTTDQSNAISHFWTDATESAMSQRLYRDMYALVVQHVLAQSYAPYLVGWQVFNEPNPGNMAGTSAAKTGNMQTWLAPVVDTIHALDPQRAKFIMARGGGQGFGTAPYSAFGSLSAKKIILEFHQYYTGLAPGYPAVTTPDVGYSSPGDEYFPDSNTVHNTTVGSTYAGSEVYQEAFLGVPLARATALGVPAFMGELGVHFDDTGRLAYTSQIQTAITNLGISFSIWKMGRSPGDTLGILDNSGNLTDVGQAWQTWFATDPFFPPGAAPVALTDSISVSDVLTRRATRPLADSIAVSDSLATRRAPRLSDSIAVSETITRREAPRLADSIAVSDSLVSQHSIRRSLADSFSISDSLASTQVYIWQKAATYGGGYQNIVAPNPSAAGLVFAGGDLWGVFVSTDGGSRYAPSALGIVINVANAVNGNLLTRAGEWSKKDPATVYYGMGGNTAGYGSGSIVRLRNGTYTKAASDTSYGFGTLGQSNANRPRSSGRLIAVDYDVTAGTEYLYALMSKNTNNAVLVRSTDGGDTATELLNVGVSSAVGDVLNAAWKALVVVDSNADGVPDTLLAATYRDPTTDTTTRTGSELWKISAGSASIRAATGTAQVTAAQITPPAAIIEDLCVVGTTIYAACGPYGLYKSVNFGTSWSSVSSSFFASSWVGSVDATGAGVVVGCTRDSAAGHNVALSTNSGSSWAWVTQPTVTHGTGGNINSVPWGTDKEWWLLATGAPSFTNYLGGSTFDTQMVRFDPTDPTLNTIYACGSGGNWLTKDGGGSWRPSIIGLNGSEVGQVFAGANGVVYNDDQDWNGATSTDYMRTAARLSSAPTGFVNTGITDKTDGSGNTYHLVTTTGAPDLTRNGVSIATLDFKQGLTAPTDMQVSPEGVVYVGQQGGGVTVGIPASMRVGRVLTDTISVSDQLRTARTQIALTDSLSVSDVITTGATRHVSVPLSDTIAVSESLTARRGPQLVETISVSDTLRIAVPRRLADSITISDSLASQRGRALIEFFPVSESLATRRLRPLTDTIPVSDALAARPIRPLSDSIAISDNLAAQRGVPRQLVDSFFVAEGITTVQRVAPRQLADSIAVSDVIAPRRAPRLADAIVVSESLARTAPRPLTDTISVSDQLATRRAPRLSDTIAVSETLTKRQPRALVEFFPISDQLASARARSLSDTVAISDVIRTRPAPRLSDTITVSDVLATRPRRALVDTILVSDALAIGQPPRQLVDSIAVSDALRRAVSHQPQDSIAVSDVIPARPGRQLVEQFFVAEGITSQQRVVSRTLSESIVVSDHLVPAPTPRLTDSIIVSDILTKRAVRQLSDTIAVSDAISRVRTRFAAPSDSIAISETLRRVPTRALVDSIPVSDVILAGGAVRTLLDQIAISEHLAVRPARPLTDSIAVSDFVRRGRALRDSFPISDSVHVTTAVSGVPVSFVSSDLAAITFISTQYSRLTFVSGEQVVTRQVMSESSAATITATDLSGVTLTSSDSGND